MLTPEELQRYQRQIMVRGFGTEGQEKLKSARVFIAGAGGLGSPVALYLAAAGIGSLRIVDMDSVDLTNLNRQILHWTPDIGRDKVDSAGHKLRQFNPEINIDIIKERITADNVESLLSGYNLIVDALDNLPSRYLLNQYAIQKKIPLFHGAISGFEGRAMTVIPGHSACLMCLYQGIKISAKTPVIGSTPGVIACIQATEVIKYLTGLGRLLTDRFLIYDGLEMKFSEIKVSRNTACEHCGNTG